MDARKEENVIGILTGGGDCAGLNAVLRAASSTASNYGYKMIGFHDGFEGLYLRDYVQIDSSDVSDLLHVGGTILGTTNRGHYGLPLVEDVVNRSVEAYKDLGLKCLICVGGDGTMSIANKLSDAGLHIVGVPKTIDNDLMSTDQTFGFDSAVHVATKSLDRLHTTAASHHRVMVVEVMGRNSGWIALYAGIAGAASVILIPEVAWKWDEVIAKIKERVKVHRFHYCIVVVAEGTHLPPGSLKEDEKEKIGTVGQLVAKKISALTNLETRTVVLGHTQRGGSPTCYDRILATKFGSMAAKLACEGDYGKMVSLKGTQIVTELITDNMEKQRSVEIDTDQLVWTAKSIGVSFGDETEENKTQENKTQENKTQENKTQENKTQENKTQKEKQ